MQHSNEIKHSWNIHVFVTISFQSYNQWFVSQQIQNDFIFSTSIKSKQQKNQIEKIATKSRNV